ncbi:MAG: hypothetical protein RLZZ399_2686, partial [Verrucomicrobiota bacterium]
GGFEAISRWLSEATPPDLREQTNASRRDAGAAKPTCPRPFLARHFAPEWIQRVDDYLGGTVKSLGGSQGIGGTSDHVHLLVGLPASQSLLRCKRLPVSGLSEGPVCQHPFGMRCVVDVGPGGRALRDRPANGREPFGFVDPRVPGEPCEPGVLVLCVITFWR